MYALVDMDDVIADYEAHFLKTWKTYYPDLPFVPLEERRTKKVEDEYPVEHQDLIEGIKTEKGFFRDMPAIQGAKEALEEMLDLDWRVAICSSPSIFSYFCMNEKYEWVEEELGPEWIGRIILTKDKSLIKADYLIDDNPELDAGSWEHIIFDRPYNRHVKDKRRLDWSNWKSVLKIDNI